MHKLDRILFLSILLTLIFVKKHPTMSAQCIHIQTLSSYYQKLKKYLFNEGNIIYPTDTVYGIWGIVTPHVLEKINRAKQRLWWKHYSIIAPSFDWIYKHFAVEKNMEEERNKRCDKFPWRWLTLILPLKNNIINTHLRILSSNTTIWVRYLWYHPIQDFVNYLWQALISTSCNISWSNVITSVDNIPEDLKQHVWYSIDWWTLTGKPSVVIDWQSWEIIRY